MDFWQQWKKEVFLTSADWMNRNVMRRIETTFPVEDEEIVEEIFDIINLQLRDNVKARLINERLGHDRIEVGNAEPVRAQWDTFKMLASKEPDFDEQRFK
jgi:polyphosphate kinase